MKIGTLVVEYHVEYHFCGIIVSYDYGFKLCEKCPHKTECLSPQEIQEDYYPIYYYLRPSYWRLNSCCIFESKLEIKPWKESS